MVVFCCATPASPRSLRFFIGTPRLGSYNIFNSSQLGTANYRAAESRKNGDSAVTLLCLLGVSDFLSGLRCSVVTIFSILDYS